MSLAAIFGLRRLVDAIKNTSTSRGVQKRRQVAALQMDLPRLFNFL